MTSIRSVEHLSDIFLILSASRVYFCMWLTPPEDYNRGSLYSSLYVSPQIGECYVVRMVSVSLISSSDHCVQTEANLCLKRITQSTPPARQSQGLFSNVQKGRLHSMEQRPIGRPCPRPRIAVERELSQVGLPSPSSWVPWQKLIA